MAPDKSPSRQTKPTTRERVLDAAERLLAEGSAEFSMRELASEAEVSFATPFNQFGSKAAIMQALSARRIALMHKRFAEITRPQGVVAREFAALDIAVSVMLAAPGVNRAVMGAIGAPSDDPGNVASRSGALWAEALGNGSGLASATRALAMTRVPYQLAIAFRGVLSFWTAGELNDKKLGPQARKAFATVLLGFVECDERAELLALLEK